MRAHPFERFLGVPANADVGELLNVDVLTCDAKAIDAALRQRLTMINRHPGGESQDAEMVRTRLSSAADELRAAIASGRRPAPKAAAAAKSTARPAVTTRNADVTTRPGPRIELTSFDQQVLGTLVGSGGWNHASRARLVSIAAAHRVTVHGLLKVIHGLNDYARSGGARLDVATITAGKRTLVPASQDIGRRSAPSLAERLLPDLKEPTPGTTVKWSLVFGIVAMVVGAGVIALVLRGGDRSEPSELARPADEPAVAVDVERQPEAGSSESGQREPATFAQKPTFTQPIEAIVLDEWISACAVIPETLRHIAARVHVSPEPAEAVYREWGDAVETASRAWLRLDEPLQQDILNALRSVLEECSDRPAVSDRLLGELSIPEARIDEPIDLSRRLWRVRVLVELTQSIRLSLAVRERCELHLRAAMPDFDSVTNQGVDEVMAKMLRSTLPALTSALQRDGDVYALWEVWLHSVGRFVDVNDHNKLRLDGIEAVLASQHDLVTPGPAANVLGRLIDEIDWREAPEAKSRLAEWCHSTSNITSEDLWILTSLLSERESMAWLLPQFIVPRSADESHRRRVRDQMAAAWPTVVEQLAVAAPAGRGVDVDPQLASQWRELQRTVLAERLVQQQEALASQLAILARLNEAASLLEQGETVAADEVMQWIEQVRASGSIFDGVSRLSSPRGPFGSGIHRAPGQAIGQDGVWAQAYQQIGTNAEERIKLLRALRSTAGTDLGPTDAATFVREVYRATPLEVRTMAQSIAMEFRLGPIVAQHMLDQLPDAVHNEGTSEFLGRFIGRSLPPVRSERWKIEARLLMTEHCLSLLDSMEVTIDRAADIIADAVASQGPTVDRELVLRARGLSPAEAAELVRTSWYESARNVVAAEPVPSDVATLDRRHRSRKALAIGPIQSFVASRLGHMELFAFLVSAEQPGLRVTLSSLLTASSDRRAQMTDALQQAIEIERVMAQLHSLRMQQTAATMEVYP